VRLLFDIKEETVKYWADEFVYKKAEDYYKNGKVKNINVIKTYNKDLDFNEIKIESIVEDNGKEISNVIVFNDKTGVENVKCKCMEFRNYYLNDKICPHIAASMFKYIRDKNSITGHKYSAKTRKFIDQIKNSMVEKESSRKELNMEIKLEVNSWSDRGSNLQLKIGEDRLYVVRNMREFITSYIGNTQEMEFAKGFTFDPKIHHFNEKDEKIIKLIEEIYEDDQRNYELGYTYNSNNKILVGKKAHLTDTKVRRFLHMIKDRQINISLKAKEYKDVTIIEDTIPLEFELLSKDSEIELIQKQGIPYPITKNGEYFFYDGFIYKVDKEKRKLYITFYNAFSQEKKNIIKFDIEDSEKIASYIIPSLKKISDNIVIDSSLEEKFYQEPLNIKIYLDKSNDMVMGTIKFCYGDVRINPLAREVGRAENSILVRDVETELNIINLFKSYKFQKYGDQFINNEEEEIVDFLNNGIRYLQDYCEIYYSNSFKNLKMYGVSYYSGGIKLNDNDLLEFNFQIEGVDKKELKNIFEALRQRKKYYKLKKGGFVPLESEEIKNIGNMIDFLDIKDSELENENFIIPKYSSVYIDENIKLYNMDYIKRNNKFTQLINNIRNVKDADFFVPSILEKIMRKYQKFGFKWLKALSSCGFGGILADEMGLGKTLQIISFLASELEEGNKIPSIVISPTSLVYNWVSEIEKFYPNLKVLVISGSKEERREGIERYSDYDILITSYPLIRRDIEYYNDINFKYCILDEAQQIKNPNSMNAKSVKEIKAKNYFALTGTPIENSLTELWSIFDFIMPGYLLSHGRFMKKYESPIVKENDKVSLEELNKHIRPFILRRLKSEVIKELPPKIEHKISVEMTEEQKKVYAAYLQNAKEQVDNNIREKGFNKSKLMILSILTRLRQICCDPSIFIDNYKGDSGKLIALDDIIEDSINAGHRILIFSQFTSVLKNIGSFLYKKNIEYMYLDGQTKMQERGKMVDAFNKGKGYIFLISLKAGGTGLNLTGADVVIHYDPWWNPAVEQQASDRAHRIGQKKTVEVIKLIARGTIEEKIYELQEKKRDIIKSVMDMDSAEESIISRMSEEEIKDILSS
jgi:SNF2 family DNA or RNA helicase